jgi:hypothetical protein
MPPTPLPYRDWEPVQGLRALTESQADQLVGRLPLTPPFTLISGFLSHGFARAFVAGKLENPEAVVVQSRNTPDELEIRGPNPAATWDLVSRIPGWFCLVGSIEEIEQLAPILEREVPFPYRPLGDLFFRLDDPARPHGHPSVRLLGVSDIPLLEAAGPEIRAAGYRSYEEALTEGIIAAAIVGGRIVAIAENAASSARYSDIGVRTLEPFRRRGLSSAAAYLVAREVQARGRVPIWSTASDNVASQRVATKLGFQPAGRGGYVVFDGLREAGGFRPR